MDSFELFNALIVGIFDEMDLLTVRVVYNRQWTIFLNKDKYDKKEYISSNLIKLTV